MKPSLGATYLGDGRCRFVVWAPLAQAVDVCIIYPAERIERLNKKKKAIIRLS